MIQIFIIVILLIIYIVFYKKHTLELFENEIKYYVIHMKNNTKRYENIKKQEKNGNIEIEIFDASDGSKVNIDELNDGIKVKNPWNTHRYNSEKDENIKKKIMNGEIGCYLSHLNLLKKIADTTNNDWTVVFEDDFVIDKNFKDELNKILKIVNKDIDIIYLGNVNQFDCKKGKFKDNLCYPDIPWGTQGYMVNKKSARKIYDLIKYIDEPIDNKYISLMNDKKINGLVVVPSLVNQDSNDTPSIINGT
jgi:GR25 family glycosyltransferase involved in LPS biosynthesis